MWTMDSSLLCNLCATLCTSQADNKMNNNKWSMNWTGAINVRLQGARCFESYDVSHFTQNTCSFMEIQKPMAQNRIPKKSITPKEFDCVYESNYRFKVIFVYSRTLSVWDGELAKSFQHVITKWSLKYVLHTFQIHRMLNGKFLFFRLKLKNVDSNQNIFMQCWTSNTISHRYVSIVASICARCKY